MTAPFRRFGRLAAAALGGSAALAATAALADPQPTPHDMGAMPGMAAAPSSSPTAPPAGMAGMDMGGAPGMAGMDMHGMTGGEGRYPMSRDASGTAWQPDSSPMPGIMGEAWGWSTMLHGYATLLYDSQGGRRGEDKTFVESMLMGMAQRPLGGGTLTLRAMGSLDPFMGKGGYPLLFQTGETADGRTQLVDRQHPHDLFMEVAAVYSHPVARGADVFLYAAPVGEPALGPATYMHRFSGIANPETPLGHHWLDSTHITFGVVTGGLVLDTAAGPVKLEASGFTGREPNQHRYDWDHPRMDSWSVRATWNPSADWSMQVSRGHLVSPEQLEPDEDQDRTTASATWNRKLALWGRTGDAQATFAWGRDEITGRSPTHAFLLDGAAELGADTVFARVERVDKDELFSNTPGSPLNGPAYTVNKVSLGYFRTLDATRHTAVDLGGLVSRYAYPRALDAAYGADPTSFMLFASIKLR